MATRRDINPGVLDAIYHRRAIRSYAPEKIPEAIIRKLLDAAVQAPTAMHLEPWAFAIIQDEALLKRLSDRAKQLAIDEAQHHRDLLRAPGVADTDDHLSLLRRPEFNIFYNASTLVAICARPMGHFVTADCWLAAQNLMLAATAMNLGTCCIGFAVPVLNVPDVKRELGIPADVTVVAPIIVGVPIGPIPSVPRNPPEILRWVR